MNLRACVGLAVLSLVSLGGCFEDPNDLGGTTNDTSSGGDGDGDPSGDGDGDPSGDGDGDPSGDGDGDPSGDGDGDPTGGTCDADQDCVDPAPVGWDGPLSVYVGLAGEPPPTCGGDTPIKIAELYEQLLLNESADTCECQCGNLTGASCGAVVLEQRSSCVVLGNLTGSWNLAPSTCNSLGSIHSTANYRILAPPVNGGNCAPSVVADIVEADFANRVIACGVSDNVGTCDAGVCLTTPEAPFDGRICIATQGDVQCPSGAYSARTVYYTGSEDDRSCADCGCAPPQGATCSGEVDLSTSNCGLLTTTINIGGCSSSGGNVSSASFTLNPITAECSPSTGAIQGEAEPTGEWTFCCQP